MLHGCPICPIGLIIFPHLHKFGRRVLTTCGTALAWPRRGPVPPGAALGHALPPDLPTSSKFLKKFNPPPGLGPIFRQCDQGIIKHRRHIITQPCIYVSSSLKYKPGRTPHVTTERPYEDKNTGLSKNTNGTCLVTNNKINT